MDLYEVLHRWNLWGEWEPEWGFERVIVSEIGQYLDEPDIIAIAGPRRAGKSTVMYQLMQWLGNKGVSPEAILHVNFEEPSLATSLDLSLLDKLYDTYRARINPQGKAYIFFDEIQNVPEWERWVRARSETDNVKIIVTGSSSQLLSRELGTLLTGRHLNFTVYPLSFSEQLQFKKIEVPKEIYPNKSPPIIQHALLDYMKWGGMPRIVISDNNVLRERILKRYFEDILYKDVVMRHSIRDVHTLRNIAVYLLTQTGSLISYKRLCELFSASHDLVQSYCHYLQEAFLIELLPLYTLKTGERIRNPMKSHAIDIGLRRVVCYGQPSDKGKLIESLVYRKLLSTENDGIFYWHGEGEVDLLTRQGIEISQLIQVSYSGLSDEKTLRREIQSLIAAGKCYPEAQKILIAYELPSEYPGEIPKDIKIIPLWKFLLE